MIERNLAMIDNGKQQIFKATPSDNEKSAKKITKPADIVRMYDLLLQVNDHSSPFLINEMINFSF
jgi:hypothetical protein